MSAGVSATAAAWVAAIATVGLLTVAVVAAVAAFKQIGEAKKQVAEARTLREEQAQPFVVVDFEMNRAVGHPFVDLVVRNTGQTLAKNVKIEFDPPIRSTLDRDRQAVKPLAETSILKDGIPTLPPGAEHKILYERMPDRYEDTELERRYTVTVHFDSMRSKEKPLTFTLDLDIFYGYRRIAEYNIHHIAKTLRSWAQKEGVHKF